MELQEGERMGRTDKQQQIEKQVLKILRETEGVKITDNESCERLDSQLTRVKAMRRGWAGFMDPEIRVYDGKADALRALKKRLDDPLARREIEMKQEIAGWVLKVKAQERKAQIEAEQRAAKDAEKAREREAEALRKAGNAAEARQLEKQPIIVSPIVSRVQTPKIASYLREDWKFRIVDVNAIPREFMIPDMLKIGKLVRAMKSETRISGIEVYSEASMATGVAS